MLMPGRNVQGNKQSLIEIYLNGYHIVAGLRPSESTNYSRIKIPTLFKYSYLIAQNAY